MGLFDRKKRIDDDEEDGESQKPEMLPPLPQAQAKAPPPPPPKDDDLVSAISIAPEPDPEPPLAFGIEEAVILVRQLPSRSNELVMQVVKKTLESVGVDVGRIIESATQKEVSIERRINELRAKIDDLETQIAGHKREISSLEVEQREVNSVKERLVLAQRIEAGDAAAPERPIPSPRPAASPNLPPPPPAAAPKV